MFNWCYFLGLKVSSRCLLGDSPWRWPLWPWLRHSIELLQSLGDHQYTYTGGGWSSGSHLGKQLRNICHCSGWLTFPRWKKIVLIQNPQLYFRKKNFQIIIFFNFLGNFEFMKLSSVLWLAMICWWHFFEETNNLTSFEHPTWFWFCLK